MQGQEGRWFSVSARLWSPLVITGALVAVAGVSLIAILSGLGLAMMLIATWLVILAVGGFVRFARAAIWPHTGIASIAMWGWLLGAGPVLFLTLCLVLLTTPFSDGTSTGSLAIAEASMAFLGSLLATVMAVTFADTATATPIGAIPALKPRARLEWRAGIIAATLAVVPMYVLLFGSASVPMLAPPHVVPADRPDQVDFHFSGLDPRSTFVKVKSADAAGRWYRVPDTPHGATVNALATVANGDLLFVPQFYQHLAAQRVAGGSDASLKLEPIPVLGPAQDLRLSEKESTVFLLNLTREPDTVQWSGAWKPRLPPGSWHAQTAVNITLLTGGGVEPSGTIQGEGFGTRAINRTQPLPYVLPTFLAQLGGDAASVTANTLKVWVTSYEEFEFGVTFTAADGSVRRPSTISIPAAFKIELPPPSANTER
jgi:hypothetical protein